MTDSIINESDLVDKLLDLFYDGDVETDLGIASVCTFAQGGLMTNNDGVILRLANGAEFQLTIIQSERAQVGITLDAMAAKLREHDVPAIAGSTGGNCNSVIIPLVDGGELLIGDVEGPCTDTDTERVASWVVSHYAADRDGIDLGEDLDVDAVLALVDAGDFDFATTEA